jgi:hypothetical protein
MLTDDNITKNSMNIKVVKDSKAQKEDVKMTTNDDSDLFAISERNKCLTKALEEAVNENEKVST